MLDVRNTVGITKKYARIGHIRCVFLPACSWLAVKSCSHTALSSYTQFYFTTLLLPSVSSYCAHFLFTLPLKKKNCTFVCCYIKHNPPISACIFIVKDVVCMCHNYCTLTKAHYIYKRGILPLGTYFLTLEI